MIMEDNQKTVLVTGSAGFIGYHISKKFLDEGWRVIGIDSMSDYYDVSLKEARESILIQSNGYVSLHAKIEEPGLLFNVFDNERPDVVIHLAAQAGVRSSIESPRQYLESNIIGTFELLEAARSFPPKHMLLASTSSAYGASEQMPYRETNMSDHQVSFYAATKKSSENIAHSYSHLYNLPITMFRFFTVYGPWGRPDMAPMKFTKSILSNEVIDVYNYGDMKRDFTYIEDLTKAIWILVDKIPEYQNNRKSKSILIDSLSPVAPFRIVNIGNSVAIKLTEFIEAIEGALGKKSNRNLLPMQAGDVKETWANVELLKSLTGYVPNTSIKLGVSKFINWYCDFYRK
jgi:UDP-glucuronate 4-epimerase